MRARCAVRSTVIWAGADSSFRPTLVNHAHAPQLVADDTSSQSTDLVRCGQELPMSDLTPDQQKMLATWQQHTYAEFVLKDADAALATMTDEPYVFLVPLGLGRVGRAVVHEFYA